MVDADGVKGADDGGGDDEADEDAEGDAEPDLAAEALVQVGGVGGDGERLLEPGEEDRHDDDGFEGFAEDDEEDGHGKDLGRHVFVMIGGFLLWWVGGKKEERERERTRRHFEQRSSGLGWAGLGYA